MHQKCQRLAEVPSKTLPCLNIGHMDELTANNSYKWSLSCCATSVTSDGSLLFRGYVVIQLVRGLILSQLLGSAAETAAGMETLETQILILLTVRRMIWSHDLNRTHW